MTYSEAVEAITALESRGWRLGLDRMREFCRLASLDNSLRSVGGPQFIQVAGTNGKGSTTEFIRSILVEAGLSVGSFFSPFVVDYRERIQVGRRLISESELAATATRLFPIAESLADTHFGGVTKFEFETAMGLQFWKDQRCEWVSLEVGLGGRLDATSVVDPRCSVIVSIGLDHVSILGDTVGKIALEKAGIIRKGRPVVLGNLPEEAIQVCLSVASEQGAPVWRFGREFDCQRVGETYRVETPGREIGNLSPGLHGADQAHNMALAIAAIEAAGCEVSDDAIRTGVARARLPGRLERRTWKGRQWILDGAHNEDAGHSLARSLRSLGIDHVHLVTNMLRGHDPTAFYRTLRAQISEAEVVPIDFERALPVESATELLRELGLLPTAHPTLESGLVGAISKTSPDSTILVTGSNYVVGDALRLMRFDATSTSS